MCVNFLTFPKLLHGSDYWQSYISQNHFYTLRDKITLACLSQRYPVKYISSDFVIQKMLGEFFLIKCKNNVQRGFYKHPLYVCVKVPKAFI